MDINKVTANRLKSRAKSPNYCMGLTIAVFLALLIAALLIRVKQQKGACSYDVVYRRISCRFKERTEIPADLSETALALYIGNKRDKHENQFGFLRRQNFSRYPMLQEIVLISCGIKGLEAGLFSDNTRLRRIDLSFNRIVTLEANTFESLLNVEQLILSHNSLTKLDSAVFSGLIVNDLVFDTNEALTQVAPDAFTNSTVQSLTFRGCSLTTLSPNVFQSLNDSLKFLTLTNNLRKMTLPRQLWHNLNLTLTDLSGNKFDSLQFVTDIKSERIILDDNQLPVEDLQKIWLRPQSKYLSLKRTGLTEHTVKQLGSNFNAAACKIEHLDLRGNSLQYLDFSWLQSCAQLQSLDVSSNGINYISSKSYDGTILQSLTSLYLHDNRVRTVAIELQQLFQRLKNVTLHDNPWHCNCQVCRSRIVRLALPLNLLLLI